MGDTSKNRSKHQQPNKRAKNPAAKLRGASWKSWIHTKQDGGNGKEQLKEQMKEMAKTNIALQKRTTQLENDLEKKSEENAKFEKKLGG